MPTTRKQKKARKSRGLEMLSDIENLDIMLGENHFNSRERDESLNSNLARRTIVPLVTISETVMRICTKNIEILVQGLMSITARIQSVLILMLRSIDCRAN